MGDQRSGGSARAKEWRRGRSTGSGPTRCGPEKDITQFTLTPRVKRVVEIANEEAKRLGHSHVGTERRITSEVMDALNARRWHIAGPGLPPPPRRQRYFVGEGAGRAVAAASRSRSTPRARAASRSGSYSFASMSSSPSSG